MILINTVASQMFHNTAHRWLQQRHDGRTVLLAARQAGSVGGAWGDAPPLHAARVEYRSHLWDGDAAGIVFPGPVTDFARICTTAPLLLPGPNPLPVTRFNPVGIHGLIDGNSSLTC